MAKRKSQPKKKRRTGLIIAGIVSATVLLLTTISLLVFQPWNSTSGSTSKFSSNSSKPMTFDDDLVDAIKDHEYQSLRNTKNYSLANFTKKYSKDSDGNFKFQAPADWSEDEFSSSEYKLRFDPNYHKTGVNLLRGSYSFETKPGEEEDYRHKITKLSAEDIIDETIKGYDDGSSLSDGKVIYKYQKNINEIEYQIVIIKENFESPTDNEKREIYHLFYARELDNSDLKRSILLAEAYFFAPRELNKEELLNGVFTFENVLGNFDEKEE